MMIANARMYTATSETAQRWRALFDAISARAGVALEVVAHPAPRPLDQLWGRPDMGAVFMCGLPFARAQEQPFLLAAPVPSPREFASAPMYWSNIVVRAGSRFRTVSDTFGHRLALTVPGSQSGYAAALRYFATHPGPEPRFDAVIAPTISPRGALQAVVDGAADLAPIDSYAFHLLERFDPQLTARVQVIARTAATAIPALVSSTQPTPALRAAIMEAHIDPTARALMKDLLLERFVAPSAGTYDLLRHHYAEDLAYWRQHSLASNIHPAFAAPGHGLRADADLG